MTSPFEIKRRIARLNDLIERAQQHAAIAFGRSTHAIMGNDHEHARWSRIKLNEPELSDQDDAGKTLLPTWPDLTADLYSAMRRTATVLYDEDQIAPSHRGNHKLLAPLVLSDEWDRIHDMTMGDDNMSVIAALKIQEGWLTDLQKQKDEAAQRCQEQQQRAQQRKERKEQGDDDSGADGEGSAGGGDQQDDAGDDGDNQPGEQPGNTAGAGEEGGSDAPGEAPASGGDGDAEEDGLDESDASNPTIGGSAAGSGPGANSQSVGEDAGPQDAGYDGEPEPNNAVEAADAGAAHASAVAQARLALEEAERLAEAFAASNDPDDLDAVEAALEAAERLTEASDDTLERILAQEAFDAENQSSTASESLKKALKMAAQDLKEQEEVLRAWGVGKADLQEMSPTDVMELSKLLRNSPDLRKIADLLGYQRREIQKRKVRDRYAHGPEVRVGVEQGRALHKMVSSQRMMARLAPNVFRYRYLNNQLIQHQTRIHEVQERGDGWLLIDASGSMFYGEPYTYNQIARATAITVVDYFQREGRNCTISLFDDGVRETIHTPAGLSRADLLRRKLQIAQHGYGGGTDFYEPLRTALTGIQQGVEYWDKSSVVMITDGQCYMSEAQCQEIKRLQDETKVDIQAWVMPGGRADQMKQFGPVDSVQTSLQEAAAMALKMVERMDAQWSI